MAAKAYSASGRYFSVSLTGLQDGYSVNEDFGIESGNATITTNNYGTFYLVSISVIIDGVAAFSKNVGRQAIGSTEWKVLIFNWTSSKISISTGGTKSIKFGITYRKNSTAQEFYEETSASADTMQIGEIVPISINSLTGNYETTFVRLSTFNHDNLKVVANMGWEGTSTVLRTEQFDPTEVLAPNMTVVGTKTVTVKLNELSTTYQIVVKPLRGISLSFPSTFTYGKTHELPYPISADTTLATILGGNITAYLIEEGVVTQTVLSVTPSVAEFEYSDITDKTVKEYSVYERVTYDGVALEESFSVHITYKCPVSLSVSGTDGQIYYNGRTNKFKTPTGLTYKAVYNDGTEETITPTRFEDSNGAILIDNQSSVAAATSILYVVYVGTDGKSASFEFKQTYELQYQDDTISNVELTENLDFYLGNTLESKKSSFKVRVTYTHDGQYVDNFQDFTFVDTSVIMSALQSNIQIIIWNNTYSLDYTKVTFKNPTVSDLEVVNSPKQAFINNLDKIDISTTKIVMHFSECSYTKEFSMGSSVVGDSTHYSIAAKYSSDDTALFSPDTIDNYNGVNDLSLTISTGFTSAYFEFTVTNPFSSTTSTKNTYFDISSAVSIEGISVVNTSIYNSYKVGDKFLNENDTTKIIIYWKDNGVLKSKSVDLNKNYPSLVINPSKDYEFINVDKNKTIRVSSVVDNSVYVEYSIKVSPRNYSESGNTDELVAVWYKDIILPDQTQYSPAKGVLKLFKESDTTVTNGIRTVVGNPECYGYIDDIFDDTKTSKVVLYKDYVNPIEGSSNIDVLFPCWSDEAKFINKCTFGCLFGANNSVNRLFISGNEDVANADWHSAELNLTDYDGDIESSNGDFSYFPSESVMYYGETDNAVIGYDIVSNDKLLVLKSKSDKEKTVYFRTPTLLKAFDSSGNVMTDINGDTLYQEEFSLVKGNNSVAGISPNSIINFNGDTLFIDSDNHVSGLDLVGIVGDNQRYASSRSKYIDYKLKDYDLSDTVLWSNNKYLFMPIEDVGLFVTHFDKKADDQYEWWKLTSNNPRVFIEIDNQIYFGNKNGSFCKFFNGTWSDIKKIFSKEEQNLLVKFNDGTERIIVESSIMSQMDTTKSYMFSVVKSNSDYMKNIYYQVAKARKTVDANTDVLIDGTNNVLKIVGRVNGEESLARKAELYELLTENKTYYLNYLAEDTPSEIKMDCSNGSAMATFGKGYKLVKVSSDESIYNDEYDTFKLFDVDGTRMTLSELNNAGICLMLEENVDVSDIEPTTYSFMLKRDGNYLNLVKYGHQEPLNKTVEAEIREYEGVEAFYITSPMLCSNLNSFKTIWQISLTNDTDIPSALRVCYASNKIPYYDTKDLATISKDRIGVDFNNMAFTAVDYDKNTVPRTYTFNRILAMQKFICFGFKNESGCNAVLSEMAITYTIPYPSYGSD